MTTSEHILSLCRELGVEEPSKTLIVRPLFHEEVITASDLLRWGGWGDGTVPDVTRWKFDGKVTFDATYVNDIVVKVTGIDSPDEALRLLAVQRLEEIKEERK